MNNIIGKVIPKVDITATVGIPFGGKRYEGEYEAVPTVNGTILPTANKLLANDITIDPIPYHETPNVSGGNTVVIAQEE